MIDIPDRVGGDFAGYFARADHYEIVKLGQKIQKSPSLLIIAAILTSVFTIGVLALWGKGVNVIVSRESG